MYCDNCGNPLRDGAKFCNKCGKKAFSPEKPFGHNAGLREDLFQKEPRHSAQKREPTENRVPSLKYYPANEPNKNRHDAVVSHPYHKPGGWLMVIVIFCFVLASLLMIQLILSAMHNIQYLRNTAIYLAVDYPGYYGFHIFYSIGEVFVLLADIALLMFCAISILTKNRLILLILQTATPAIVLTNVFYAIIVNKWYSFFAFNGTYSFVYTKCIVNSIVLGLFVIVVSIYFSKSVRVRTYMGSDEYLKKSVFNRWASPPMPADIMR